MCWQCDHPGATTADYLKELRATIRKRKWVVQYVEDDKKPFAYTIGLHKRGFAEYLVTGVTPERAIATAQRGSQLHHSRGSTRAGRPHGPSEAKCSSNS